MNIWGDRERNQLLVDEGAWDRGLKRAVDRTRRQLLARQAGPAPGHWRRRSHASWKRKERVG